MKIKDLFKHVAPHCEPLPDLLGVCTQLDNYLAGLTRETPPEPPHVRADYREVWLSGWRAGQAEALER